jgi:hypothetical protein
MSDKESNRDAIARRLLEIATYNELTGAGAPVPRPDPRGQDFRGLQRYPQDLATYNALTGNVPVPQEDPRKALQRRQEEIDTYNMLTGNVPLPQEDPRGRAVQIPPLEGAMYPPEPTDYEAFYAGKKR